MRLLGSGGFGEVYEADDTAMHRVVALKLLGSTSSQNPVFRERLFREARTAGRLREPHVVPIHACGEIDGQVYIDMRLVRGVVVGILHRRPATQHAATATPRPSSTGPPPHCRSPNWRTSAAWRWTVPAMSTSPNWRRTNS
jgi:serine/threonine-protein kinase